MGVWVKLKQQACALQGFFENALGSADNVRASAAWAKFLKRTPVILQILDN